MKTIVLFTNTYPYSTMSEYTFIEPELQILNKYFKIILVPLFRETNRSRQLINDLYNISIENVKFDKYKEIFNILELDSILIKELQKIKNKKHIKDLIIRYIKMKWIEKFIKSKLEKDEWNKEYIYYTYWFDFATTALINLKNEFNLKVITRAHRYDLYEEKRNGYIPFRERDVRKIDKIITISKQGYNYLKNKYKIENILNSYLGINNQNITNPINSSEKIKIVSCALISPVKRIDLIMEFLSKISTELNIEIEWHHIGSGKLEKDLKKMSKKFAHKLFDIKFVGYLENEEIFRYYMNNPFDYFVTLSASEGLPVSLMEACSVGLPIIATNVGGVSEIVQEKKNGFLLSSNLSYDEFKNKVIEAIGYKHNKQLYNKLRTNSKEIFLQNFEANKNYEKFAEILNSL